MSKSTSVRGMLTHAMSENLDALDLEQMVTIQVMRMGLLTWKELTMVGNMEIIVLIHRYRILATFAVTWIIVTGHHKGINIIQTMENGTVDAVDMIVTDNIG